MTTVVSIRRLVAAAAVKTKRRQWGPIVDGVERERLHEGRCLRTMGNGGGEHRVRLSWAGAEILS